MFEKVCLSEAETYDLTSMKPPIEKRQSTTEKSSFVACEKLVFL